MKETHIRTKENVEIKKNDFTKKIRIIMVITLCFLTLSSQAQEPTKTDQKEKVLNPFELNKSKMIKPILAVQTWATYSMGEEKNGTEYADRADFSFRRLRFGASGTPYSWLSYHFQLHLDRLGEDSYASTKGKYDGIGIWDAYITAKLLKNSELLYFHVGYYWAAISREYNTSVWTLGSLDRTRANWFMRSFMTGKGNGIESGFGFGGLKNFNKFGISYRVGSFEPAAYASAKYANRLYTAHVLFSFGDPDQSSYKFRLPGNAWGKRKGVTLGFGGSTQSNGMLSETLYWDKSLAYGADLLINYGGLSIDGEYFKFKRTADEYDDFEGTQWYISAGYNIVVAGKYLQPIITYDSYEGEGSSELFNHIGDDNTVDIGINYYLYKDKLKLGLHYVIQDGSASANNGDYMALACQFKL